MTNSCKKQFLLWILAAVILIALWSMFAGSVTLKSSATNNDPFDSTIFDVLEVEEREKMVRHLWDVYSGKSVGLPKFWWEAFEAAYDHLATDDPVVRDAAVSEIAKMSLLSLPLPVHTRASRKPEKLSKKRAGAGH